METYRDYLNRWEGMYREAEEAKYSGRTIKRLSEEEYQFHADKFERIYKRIEEIHARKDYGPLLPKELVAEEDRLFREVFPSEIALLA